MTMVARTLDRLFASALSHLFNRGLGSPDRPDSGLKLRWVACDVLRRFASDPRLLGAGLLVSTAIYFTDAWKTVKYPTVELPLNFFLGVIGVLTIIVSLIQIRVFWNYMRRLTYARKKRVAANLRFQPSKPRLALDLPFVTTPGPFPAISVGRAWQHIFHSWKGERIFSADLGRYDHALLYVATLGTTVVLFAMLLLRHQYGPWLLFPAKSPLQYLFDGWFVIGVVASFGPGHYRARSTAESVAYNACAFRKGEEAVIDEDNWNLVRKFEAATGWRTLWSNNPDHLVGTDRSTHTVVLNIGWVLRSDRPSDKNRTAYLAEVLRLIRHAIDTTAQMQFCSSETAKTVHGSR